MMIHRLRYSWHVLRGRPLAYRMEIYGRTLRIPDEPNVLIASPRSSSGTHQPPQNRRNYHLQTASSSTNGALKPL
jgi:hypothetical protein